MDDQSPFACYPTVIAILDSVWGSALGDAFDNDPIYYAHHDLNDGLISRGEHYVVVCIGADGKVRIHAGIHESDLPAHAYIVD